MPLVDRGVDRRQLVVTGIKKVSQHAIEIEIHKSWPIFQQKRPGHQHLLERKEVVFQLLQQISFLRAPLVEATAAEFAFLVPDKAQLIELRDHFPPVVYSRGS